MSKLYLAESDNKPNNFSAYTSIKTWNIPVVACEDSSVCSRWPRVGGAVYQQWGRAHVRDNVHTADSQTLLADCSQTTIETQCASGLPKHKTDSLLDPHTLIYALYMLINKQVSHKQWRWTIYCRLRWIKASAKLHHDPLKRLIVIFLLCKWDAYKVCKHLFPRPFSLLPL